MISYRPPSREPDPRFERAREDVEFHFGHIPAHKRIALAALRKLEDGDKLGFEGELWWMWELMRQADVKSICLKHDIFEAVAA